MLIAIYQLLITELVSFLLSCITSVRDSRIHVHKRTHACIQAVRSIRVISGGLLPDRYSANKGKTVFLCVQASNEAKGAHSAMTAHRFNQSNVWAQSLQRFQNHRALCTP